jgi:hypothetical protein
MIKMSTRCRANMAHTRQSGPGFQVKIIKTFEVVTASLKSVSNLAPVSAAITQKNAKGFRS